MQPIILWRLQGGYTLWPRNSDGGTDIQCCSIGRALNLTTIDLTKHFRLDIVVEWSI